MFACLRDDAKWKEMRTSNSMIDEAYYCINKNTFIQSSIKFYPFKMLFYESFAFNYNLHLILMIGQLQKKYLGATIPVINIHGIIKQ